jgi:hypothetical protein
MGILLVSGQAVHIRCLSGAIRLRAMEAQSTAAKLQADADELIASAREPTRCFLCEKPLAAGAVLFAGKQLVHAACWRAPEASGGEAASSAASDTPPESLPRRRGAGA